MSKVRSPLLAAIAIVANQNKINIRRRGQAGEVVESHAAAPHDYPGDNERIPGRNF